MKNYMKQKIKKKLIKKILKPMGLFIIVLCLLILFILSLFVTLQGMFEETHVDERISRMTDIRLSRYIAKISDLSNKYESYLTDRTGHDYYELQLNPEGNVFLGDKYNNEGYLDMLVMQPYIYNLREGILEKDPEVEISYQNIPYRKYIKEIEDEENEEEDEKNKKQKPWDGRILSEIYSPIHMDENSTKYGEEFLMSKGDNKISFKKVREIKGADNYEKTNGVNEGLINTHLKYLQMQDMSDVLKNLYVNREKMENEGLIQFGDNKGVISNILKSTREMRTYFIYKAVNPELSQFMYKAEEVYEEYHDTGSYIVNYIGNNSSHAVNALYTQVKEYIDNEYSCGQSGKTNVIEPTFTNVIDYGGIPAANAKLSIEANKIYNEIEEEAIEEYIRQNEALQEKIKQEQMEAEKNGLPYDDKQEVIYRDISEKEKLGGYDEEFDEEIKKELDAEKHYQDMFKRIKTIPVQRASLDGVDIDNLLIRIVSPWGRYKIKYKKEVTRVGISGYSEFVPYNTTIVISVPKIEETFVYDGENKYVSDEYVKVIGKEKIVLKAGKPPKDNPMGHTGVIFSRGQSERISYRYIIDKVKALGGIPLLELTQIRNPDEDLELTYKFYENVQNNFLYKSEYMDWTLSEQDVDSIEEILIDYGDTGEYVGDPGGKLGYPCRKWGNITGGSLFGWRIHPVYGTKKLHTGIDIGKNCGIKFGDDVLAAEKGTVVYSGVKGGYGNAVIISHGGGVATLYAHNSVLLVKVGQQVERGDLIAQVGSTGVSTTPHIHFEVRIKGEPVDPLKYIGK